MTISGTSTIENKSKSLFIEQPEKKYTKISKDLHKLMMTGCSECTAAAYQTYSFCISMHPDSVITPAKIASNLKSIAEKNGGRALSERTIRRHLGMLEKVDLVEREYLKDKEGKFLGGLWRFFSLPTAGQKRPVDKIDDNVIELKEKIAEKQNEPIGQKGPPVYNKERVRVCKTNCKIKSSSSAEKENRPTAATASFSEKIETARINGPKISESLVSLCIQNHNEDYTFEAIKLSRKINPKNPGGYFRGAAEDEEGYSSIWERLDTDPNYIKITNDMTEIEVKCCKCYNSYLDKPKGQRCYIVWGKTAPSDACKNCPGVIQKQIKETI